ncbi:MAG: substrate-binding domain-containing protein [Opitutaceae bacterium]|nr:substrate-binding domain-containing protein [Opitutaceae bacterium]
MPSRSGATLADRVARLVADSPEDRALPTTREMGDRLGVANTTVYRLLHRLATAGVIWQHPTSGRYYPAAARALLDRPKPVACLTRRLELASEQYRELLEGVSARCGSLHRTMLLWHDDLLVNHPETASAPVFASAAQQRLILGGFLDRHGGSAGGFVLDHVWSDEALRVFGERLQPAAVLYRTCRLPGFANIRADFRLGSLMALTHLLARGFERIMPVVPFGGDPAVAESLAAFENAADEAGCRSRLTRAIPASSAAERAALIENVRREPKRTALVCAEDNVALFLSSAAREAGLKCPERVGIFSTMGTDFAARAGLTHLRHDFRLMGRLAVEALGSDPPTQHTLHPQLAVGATT